MESLGARFGSGRLFVSGRSTQIHQYEDNEVISLVLSDCGKVSLTHDTNNLTYFFFLLPDILENNKAKELTGFSFLSLLLKTSTHIRT